MGELLDQWKKRRGENTSRQGSLLEEWKTGKKYSGVDTSGVNDAYFDAYNKAANSFFSDKELREDSYERWQGLTKQADTIRAWAWQNKNKLGSNYDAIMSATDLSKPGEYWGQFGSAEDYAKAFGEYSDYNEMMNADLGALEQEIADQERIVSELKKVNMLGLTLGPVEESRSNLNAEKDKLVQKRAYYNEAKKVQAGKAYEEQARLDPEFARLSEQGGAYDVGLNGSAVKGNAVAYYKTPEGAKDVARNRYGSSHYNVAGRSQEQSLEYLAAKHMKDEEYATYSYLLGKGDEEAAREYLQSLEYQLNLREANLIAKAHENKAFMEAGYGIMAGLDQFMQGSANALEGLFGNKAYISPSATQLAGGMIREDLADAGFKVFGSSVGQIAYDTLQTTANMAPSILASTVVNYFAPGAGAYVGAGLMGASAAGNAYAEALNNGYSRDSARLYGLFVGASEAALQSVLGGISSMSGAWNISEDVLISKANAINNALLRVAAKYGIKIGSETIEEELQNLLEPLFKQIFLGGEYDAPTIEELVQTAIITAISTGALESSGIISPEVSENKTYKDNYGASQKELVAEGLELDPQSAYFKRLEQKLGEGKDLTGNEIRTAVRMNEQAIEKLGQSEEVSEAEVAEEKSATDALPEKASQEAAKIASESIKDAEVQTVTERENAPVAKETTEQAEAVRETSKEDVQTELEKASRDYGAQAKAMVATYIEGQDVEEYDAAFRIAYDMGASGVKLSYVEGMESYLTDSQKKIAYEAGKASQDAKATAREQEVAKKATGGTQRKKGVVRGEGVSIAELSAKFNDTQREAYKIMSSIAEATGVDIVLYKSEMDAKGNFEGAQGKYKKSEPGTLYIDINAGLNNIKSAGDLANYTMLRTFSHEFVHFIENYNPVWYNELRRVVFDHIENADELISREAAESGLDYEGASREVVAEALTDILPDSTFLEDLANNHKNIFEKLYAKFKEFAANIKKHFASLSPNANKAAQTLKQSGKYAEEIVKLFDKAATGAVENYQATVAEQKVETDENVIEMAKAEAEKIDQEKPKKAKKQKKIASTEAVIAEESNKAEQDGAEIVDANQEAQFSRRRNEELMSNAEEFNKRSLKIPLDTARMQRKAIYDFMTAHEKSLKMPDDIEGNTAIKNSSYDISEENTTVCIRSMAADALCDAVAEYLGRPLTVKDTLLISQDLMNYTDAPECVYCYVATDRRAYREFLGSYYKQMQDAVKALQSGRGRQEVYEEFLNGRKDTKNMKRRFAMFEAIANGAHMITAKDLSSERMMQEALRDPALAAQVSDARAYAQSASWAKKRIGFQAYNGHILDWSEQRIRDLNKHYGLRFYSFSDFSPAFILENMQQITDAAVRGLKGLAYTKELAFVEIFAPTDVNINISVFGYDQNGTVAQDAMMGADWEGAKRLRNQYPNVGITFVATNDAQIRWALDQDWIDVVIPYHLVRTGQAVAKHFGYTNYTAESADTKGDGWQKGDKKTVYPAEHNNDKQTYLDALKKYHLEPRFAKWVDHPNYMKLVNETRRSAKDTPPMQPVFNQEAAIASLERMEKQGGYFVPIGGDLENMQDIAKEIADKISADADVQYSRRQQTDQAYMDAVESGDMETAQRMVDEVAKEAGYTVKAYHGTKADFTEFSKEKFGSNFGNWSLFGAGFYFAPTESYAKYWGGLSKESADVKVMPVYLRSEKMIAANEPFMNDKAIEIVKSEAPSFDDSDVKWTLDRLSRFVDFLVNKGYTANDVRELFLSMGYDGVDYSSLSAGKYRQYVVFDPNQIKSADAVTYDDNGNVIPLSERFNEAQEDIRYQRRDGRMTDQEVLAYAVDLYKSDSTIAEGLTEAEKSALGVFEKRLGKLDGLIAERAEQGRIYRENTFQKGGDRSIAQAAHNRMEVLDGQIARASAQLLDVQEKTVLQGVLQKARKVVEQQERARGDEKLKRWRDRRENAAQIKKYRDRIEADYKELVDWLNHPLNKDVTKHVNENIKGIVIPFLLTFDFTSRKQLRGGEATKADKAHVKQAQKLLTMLDGLDEDVRYSGEYDLPLNFSERLAKHVETVQSLMDAYEGEMVINRMTAGELRDLSLLMANLKAAITTLNKFHTNAMFSHVSAAGDTTIRDLKALKDYDGNAVDTFLFWKNIRPDYAWDRFGSGGRSINLALREGQSKLAWNAKAIIDYAQSTFTAKEREEWENKVVEVSISDGRKVKTTVAALMSFYELSKRAQGRKHILDGGVTVSDVEIRESKLSKKKRVSGRYGRFTEADIEAMNAALTDRQREVADKLQQFMEKQGGEWGNHVTLARFGERAFGEKGYFPISVDKQSLSTNTDKQIKGADLYRLLNMGFTKELSENTKQPLLLYSIFDVFSTHMADMAQYNAMALPVLDAIRWLNYKEYDLDTGVEKNNLRAQMKRAFGSPVVQGRQSVGYAESFVLHILQAYNGTEAQGTPGDSLGMKMLHTYNRAQIAFNVRVVVQQPMALTRAAMILDPKYIAKALDPKKIKANVEDMLAHSGIAAWKDLGYYDINISRGLTQMIEQDSTFAEKVTEVGLKPAELADKATWGVIWAACKMQLKAQGVTDYAKVEQLFDDVIYKTQVVDSVLTKSEYMRDKGFFARSTASFMSEPTTTASMMLDAYDQYRMDIRKGMSAKQAWAVHKRNIGRTVLVYSVGAIMLAAVQAAVDGLRDDDDYQSLPEKWNEAFWSNLLDELSPLNKLPLVSTIWELFKVGLDTFTNLDVYGNPPSAAWAQWFDTLSKAWEITMDLANGETNYTWYAAIYKYLQVASGLSGLPFAAMTREAITFWNNTVGAFAPSLKVKSYELKEQTEIKYAVLDGYLSAQEAADELWEQGLASSREEAAYTAEAWEFVKDNPEYSDLTVSAYSLYKENCQGVDMGYFYQAWKYYNQAEADRDKDGNPIAGSKKRKVLDFIYQMRITTEQKKKIIKCFYK